MRVIDTAAGSERKDFSVFASGGVRELMRGRAHALIICIWAVVASSCGRTSLFSNNTDAIADVVIDGARDPGQDRVQDVVQDRVQDLMSEPIADKSIDVPPDVVADAARDQGRDDVQPAPDAAPPCQPQTEICNGRDDDCDGKIDEDLAAIPCPDGGARYCVAGVWSDCPRRCEICVPGSTRICLTSICTYWGAQACTSDGRGFGLCRESPIPSECTSIAEKSHKSSALEQCCLDAGFCCLDEFDLDHDGDRTEMLGRCEAVLCTP